MLLDSLIAFIPLSYELSNKKKRNVTRKRSIAMERESFIILTISHKQQGTVFFCHRRVFITAILMKSGMLRSFFYCLQYEEKY